MLERIVVAIALLVAVMAFFRVRTLSRRLERLTETSWELRYEYGQLRARLARLEGRTDPEPEGPPAAQAPTSFIPLTTLRRDS
ncbi:MAG: hypothetical protein AB7F99_05030 [Vicinamibacterales bacterium]